MRKDGSRWLAGDQSSIGGIKFKILQIMHEEVIGEIRYTYALVEPELNFLELAL